MATTLAEVGAGTPRAGHPALISKLIPAVAGIGRGLPLVATLAMLGFVGLVVGPKLVAGWQPFVVYTGSMEPSIPVGSIVMVQPVPFEDLAVGDVITFSRPTSPQVPITHRVVDIERMLDTNAWRVTTRGDANPDPDVWTVASDQIVGRVVYGIPLAGYALVWIAAPIGKLALLGLIVVALAIEVAMNRLRRGAVGA